MVSKKYWVIRSLNSDIKSDAHLIKTRLGEVGLHVADIADLQI